MKKVKRIARKVAQDDEEDAHENASKAADTPNTTSAVRRPALSALKSSKPNRSSSLRTSFATLDTAGDVSDGNNSTTPPRRTNLSRQILERNTEIRRAAQLPLRNDTQEDRPSYNADYLAELRKSTPTTPQEITRQTQDLDIASKFGQDALITTYDSNPSLIPTDAEIQEKKERRRRLAKERDFISLNDTGADDAASQSDDSENGDYSKRSLIVSAEEVNLKSKYSETRLEHEDEDIAEGFDSFVEDPGKVTLGRKAAKVQEEQRKKEIAEQIRSAQHGYGYGDVVSDDGEGDEDDKDDVDEEEVARNAAYEAAQTKAGMYGGSASRRQEKSREESLRHRLENQPKLRPIPDLKTVVAKFWNTVQSKEAELEGNRKTLAALERKQAEIEVEEARVQELLKEAGQRLEKLSSDNMVPVRVDGDEAAQQRGLDSVGSLSAAATPKPAAEQEDSADEDLEIEDEGDASYAAPTASVTEMFPGMRTTGFSGMGQVHQDDDDY